MTLDRRLVMDALPNYEIGEEIGRGGWGVVLSGEHRELGRSVAIKQLPRAFAADPTVRSRFKDEARLIASLDHPHIVPVYDFVEKDGLCLIVMELMPSGTLWDRFTNSGLPVDQACGLMLAANSALHFAHGRGILHRDVKPENFLFSSVGVMKLGDFGIAKLLDATQTGHTLSGQIVGTPAYMAPEQAAGETLGPFTDVYACAVMLYELLTGDLPFADTQEPLGQLMKRLTQPPLPITSVRPDVPLDIGMTVMKGLERDPAARFTSALEFAESLARSATIAFGPGWLLRSGVEVLGAPGLVAITSSPVTGAGTTSAPIAKATMRPTMSHARIDGVLVVEASGSVAERPPTSPAGRESPPVGAPPPASALAGPDPRSPTVGVPHTMGPQGVPSAHPVTPHAPPAGGFDPPVGTAPAARPKRGALVLTVLVVLVLFAAGGLVLVRARTGSPTPGATGTTPPGGGGGSAPMLAIEAVTDRGADTKEVTWAAPEGGTHYLWAVGDTFKNLVAVDRSPATVTLPNGGGVCFVLTTRDLSSRSEPSCEGLDPAKVPADLAG